METAWRAARQISPGPWAAYPEIIVARVGPDSTDVHVIGV